MVLPKIYTNCCIFVGDGSIKYSITGSNKNLTISEIDYYPTSHYQRDQIVPIADFIATICSQKDIYACHRMISCINSYSDAVQIQLPYHTFSSAGVTLLGVIGQPLAWHIYNLLIMVSNQIIYSVKIEYGSDLNNPTITESSIAVN